ncbi:MAG: hypothetical protein A3G33_02260 [Omnitrophica bacterium RIFCSPLOWO2_12_FULL_44_17]|uniref:Uncharacterized protein n=1 Tax=Candidatus Danuiimicrobium aquiferis TaxID=1801832 RepID=A0A1G1L293_9BACT|nr:MAG: hypothetical protein A3B72_08775 [Omnitrophica bacterium RIFCSPHIGHO2_02_FULL_45_28]OGW91386.1 MAG: hypothetical protein A3E74_08860 [Omnitrophica bacterium RIFCSPHIGHO2_12_FULL_44_12]OGW99238.1 MAG: hypothetical protein A3G33_02260 [Omnitrophica bacterium RIFCSPLOWO2_12_FULL_44_17]OGX03193.1 MAG: hypothetical protein A3J12_02545 [Omnitrophica bacterium RIFCSPLOWO2_02_FULL_44_11]
MRFKILAILLILLFIFQMQLFAIINPNDTARFASGFQRILMSAFQLPFQVAARTLQGPPGIGTVSGVMYGAIRTVTDVVGGVFDMGAAAAPYAKYALFAL